jgi:zona occludens toxin
LQDVRKLQLESGRPVCYNASCKLKPEIKAEFGWKLIEFKDWEAETDGTIFLMDECHKDLPKTASGAALPRYVQMLAEHRSRGFDFFLLTQHPSNINVFVRKLIGAPGWHQHLKRVAGASPVSRVLQWDAVNEKCEQNGSGKSASISTRMHPKEVYGWYDSAELHTGKVRIPKQVYVIAGCLLGIVALGFMTVSYLNRLGDKGNEKAAVSAPGLLPGQAAPGRPSGDTRASVTPRDYVAAYVPRVPSLMHTAPAYDELTKPKRVPVPAACVSMPSKGCKCFTQDGTPYPTDAAMCTAIVKHGIFLAFSPEPEASRGEEIRDRRSERVAQVEQGPSVTLIGDGRPVAAPVPAEQAPAQPQRIASVRR